MSRKEVKFSKRVQFEDGFKVFEKNHDNLISEIFNFQQKWLTSAYKRFRDIDKYIILISLINKTFKSYNEHFILNNFDEFYSKDKFEINKLNIMDISKELLISKETTRRKMMELEKSGIINKINKRVFIDRRGSEFQKPNESIKNLSRVISHYSVYLKKNKLIQINIEREVIEDKIKKNFTKCWQYFFEFQIPYVTGWKNLFGDIESWVIWENCAYNQNLSMIKNLKNNTSPVVKKIPFIERLILEGTTGINAMSLSDLTGIPRPTILRKLNLLIEKNLITKDEKNNYLIFQGNNKKYNADEVIIFKVDKARKRNNEKFVELIIKILNVVILE